MICQINMLSIFFFLFSSFLIVFFFRKTSALHILNQWFLSFENRLHIHQSFKIPRYNLHAQENQLYRQILTYLDSLPSVQDSDYTNLFSGTNPSDIFLHLDPNHTVHDTFLGAKLSWTKDAAVSGGDAFVLRIKKKDKRRVFRQYFQHILSVADEIEQHRKKDIKLYVNSGAREWRSAPFTHPASFDTVAMEAELKNKVKSDLDQFLKSKQYYHRLGRVWKRSYLLYGSPGTGKSSFVAAMAKFLCYDVYDVDVSKFSDGGDWKLMLMQTTAKSLIVIEDLDRLLAQQSNTSTASLSSVLNFMDGIVSCCGEERVMVFTMNETKEDVDQAVLRPGRVDVHIHFPLCDFSTFKILASSYLGLKEHKLFPQVEEVFQTGARLSPAEVGEIMISNRNSPSRALKTVISALQAHSNAPREGQRLSHSGSGRNGDDNEPGAVICKENLHTVKEFRKLYGLLRLGSRRKEESYSGPMDKEPPRIDGRVG
ncbi:hypothetical protein PHAVU_009G048600 [Phaseolus vulgaris]|uniref:AAA+ ATPase domain-containing protein n=1 Tax=Phaseolus vulgaris TaxID=3885 RepID=V7AS38_PHAVU|nr:hypothetical protein PHAVU_009G048600g [Phaseolus vulgaris]ESW08472.1 hypothetical protein PHAVU_009G048600g [Phaseolus vulgaris]